MSYEWLASHTPEKAQQRACAELDDPVVRAANSLGLSKGARYFNGLNDNFSGLLRNPEHYGRGVLMFMLDQEGNDIVLPFLSLPPKNGGVEAHQTTARKLREVDPRLQKYVHWSFHVWGDDERYMLYANTEFYGGGVFDQSRKDRISQRMHTMLPHLDQLVLDHLSGQLPIVQRRKVAA